MLIEETLKQIIATILNVDISIINDNSSMDNIKSWDSLRHMNLILALEEELNITIPDEEAGNITSFKLIKLVLEEQLILKKE